VWGVDFKGQFRTRDGNYCYPVTATDLCSRYLMATHRRPPKG
jgi:putative transposase